MGMHAEDILNGDVDHFTGEDLGQGQGYPRSQFNHREPNRSAKKIGIEKYIKKHIGTKVKYHIVVNDFLEETNKKIKGSHRYKIDHVSDFCFQEFANYIQKIKHNCQCDHPRSERVYIGSNTLRCNKCGKEFK